jgi:hypothetical protein
MNDLDVSSRGGVYGRLGTSLGQWLLGPRSRPAFGRRERHGVALQTLEDRSVPALGFVSALQLGGASSDEIGDLAVDHSGNTVMVGSFSGTVDFDLGPGVANLTGTDESFIAKYRPDGELLWARRLLGAGANEATGVAVDSAGNVLVTGNFFGTVDFDPSNQSFFLASEGSTDGFVLKLDADGEFVWARRFGGNQADDARTIAVDRFGAVVVAGAFRDEAEFHDTLISVTSAGQDDGYTMRLSSDGQLLWLRTVGGGQSDYANDVAVGPDGAIAVTGWFSNTVDLDPGVRQQSVTSGGSADAFVQSFTVDGGLRWAGAIGGDSFDAGYAVAIDAQGNVVVGGDAAESVDADPGTGFRELVGTGAFVVKLQNTGSFLWGAALGGEWVTQLAVDTVGNVVASGRLRFDGGDFNPGPEYDPLTPSQNVWHEEFLVRLAADGTLLDARRLADGGGPVSGGGLAVDQAGNIQVGLNFNSGVDVIPGPGQDLRVSAGQSDIMLFRFGARPDAIGRNAAGEWHLGVNNGSTLSFAAVGLWSGGEWREVRQGDFSGDGRLDLIGRTPAGQWWISEQTEYGLFTNRPFGSWNEAEGWRDVLTGDFDGDGRLDLMARTSHGIWRLGIVSGGSLQWSDAIGWNEAAQWRDVAAADMDGDGRLDLVGRTAGGQWWVSLRTSRGFASVRWSTWNEAAGWNEVSLRDLNGDGRADVVGRTAGQWWVGLNTGFSLSESNFNYSQWVAWNPAAGWRDTLWGDFNGDGRTDLAARTSSGQWYVFANNGSSFAFPSNPWTVWNEAANWRGVFAADMNGDGRSDFVGRSADGRWWIARSTGGGAVTTEAAHWNELAGWSSTGAGLFR